MPDQLVRAANGVALKGLKDMGNGTHAEVVFLGGGDSANPIPTFEQAAMGYDPSTGRTPVEATNNVYYKSGSVSEAIKAAPGFVHSISCSVKWTGAATGDTEINVALCDATSFSNKVWGKRVQGTAVNGATYANFDIVLDGIFATGIWIQVSRVDGAGAAFTSCDTTVTYR